MNNKTFPDNRPTMHIRDGNIITEYKIDVERICRDLENGTFFDNFDFDEPIQNEIKIGRNQSCPCNSGKKYKHCCLGK